jgi:hypothetical protein
MASAVIEGAKGAINGVNQQFATSAMYVPGSLQVWVNGLLKVKDAPDGWTELGSNKFKMGVAPLVGAVVQVYFRPL